MKSLSRRCADSLVVGRGYEPCRLQGQAAAAAYETLIPIAVCRRDQRMDHAQAVRKLTVGTPSTSSNAVGA
jgi:hypothetical protein